MPLYWIWLAELKEVSLRQKLQLLQHFEAPEDIFFAEDRDLSFLEDSKLGECLKNRDLFCAEEIIRRCKKKNIQILTYGDPAYPEQLRHISDPPLVLFYRGILPDFSAGPFLGVVGTRKATSYGLEQSGGIGKEISLCGGTVVSGGAAGVDAKAMQGALAAGGPVVCVLGCGADVIYPRTHRRLFTEVTEKGCILSEYPPGEKPLGWHFLRRNRIISGISQGVIVVEAPEKSGALNTAHHAWEQGRDVYAVPSNANSPSGFGSNALLREGAQTVLSGWDAVKNYQSIFPDRVHPPREEFPVRQEIFPARVAQKPVLPEKTWEKVIDNREKSSYSVVIDGKPALTDEEQAVLALLSRHPVHPDQVAENTDIPAYRLQSILTKLTLQGYAVHHPGGLVSLK